MSLTVEHFSDLDLAEVAAHQAQQAQVLQEWHPELSIRRGVVHDLNLYPQGIVLSMLRLEASRLRRSQSLAAALVDPALADDETLDNLASNFLVTRRAGARAGGTLLVVISQLVPLTIGVGAAFESQGKRFVTLQTFFVRTSAQTVESSDDRVLTPVGDGTFSFQLPVEADEDGVDYAVRRGSVFTPDPDISHFVSAKAIEDFTGGQDQESNQDLLTRLQLGPTVRAASGRTHLVSSVTAIEQFESVVAHSLLGFGDPEFLRDQHSLWPGSMGGRTDWYIRPDELALSVTLTKTATLIEKTTDGFGIWQFSIDRDEFPGFYFVDQIMLASEQLDSPQSYEITEDLRGFDLQEVVGLDVLPDIQTTDEAAYSRFQNAVIRFKDLDTATASLVENSSTQDYSAVVVGFPLISELQLHAGNRDFRATSGDILVRAPVPCFLQVNLKLTYDEESGIPDTDTAAIEMAQRVNRMGFRPRLPVAALADVIHNVLGDQVEISGLDVLGTLRYPDGTWRHIRSSNLLELPDEPDRMVTSRTTAWILDPQDIAFDLTAVSAPTL